jgi:hypothetical protein
VCFLKILIRKNKQLFTVALSYETASVIIKNGQYLDQPADPATGSARINKQNTRAFINCKKSHILFSIQQQRWYKNLLILWKARQLQDVTNPVLNTEVQTSKK